MRGCAVQDWQFFDVARLTAIYNKENTYEIYKHGFLQREAAARAQVPSPPPAGALG